MAGMMIGRWVIATGQPPVIATGQIVVVLMRLSPRQLNTCDKYITMYLNTNARDGLKCIKRPRI